MGSIDRLTEINENVLTLSKTGFIASSYEENEIFKENGFFFSRYFTVSSSSTYDFVYRYSDYTPSDSDHDGSIIVLPFSINSTAASISVNIYTDPTYAGGTEFNASNLKVNSTKSQSGSTFILSPTVTDAGTQAPNFSFTFGSNSAGASGGGGGSSAGLSVIVTDNTSADILFRITNLSSSGATIVTLGQVIYEL